MAVSLTPDPAAPIGCRGRACPTPAPTTPQPGTASRPPTSPAVIDGLGADCLSLDKWHIQELRGIGKGGVCMFSRRDFLKSSSLLCGSLGSIGRVSIFAVGSKPSGYFGVHPFVEQHPEAVFILRTHVDYKTNSDACKRVGLDFGRSVFVPMDNTGIPGDLQHCGQAESHCSRRSR